MAGLDPAIQGDGVETPKFLPLDGRLVGASRRCHAMRGRTAAR
jgi:hypothetical protein